MVNSVVGIGTWDLNEHGDPEAQMDLKDVMEQENVHLQHLANLVKETIKKTPLQSIRNDCEHSDSSHFHQSSHPANATQKNSLSSHQEMKDSQR